MSLPDALDDGELSPLHLGPSPLPNFAPISIGAPLPRRAQPLKSIPLPDMLPKVPMPGDHVTSPTSLEDGSEVQERTGYSDGNGYIQEEGPFYSDIDIQANAYGRRNRPRLDSGPKELTFVGQQPKQQQQKRVGRGSRHWKNASSAVISTAPSVPETYESIVCAPDLEQFSFEELRVACYSQCFLTTGAPPGPATDVASTLLPLYTPLVVPVPVAPSSTGENSIPIRDILMSDQPNLVAAFTFNMPASTQHL
ncbi:hypothetical protein BXZ70DRAFT_924818 [Cristinia sonorae]|uniref:Uncharacterized protein n=1 Tax=Cristinia sonorae TaxID=1940300 RepID=A0A8K0UT04_9AGAR|nr:hypothetical protein BXZ70DRAFT_924818 [Cristinia sonorae]